MRIGPYTKSVTVTFEVVTVFIGFWMGFNAQARIRPEEGNYVLSSKHLLSVLLCFPLRFINTHTNYITSNADRRISGPLLGSVWKPSFRASCRVLHIFENGQIFPSKDIQQVLFEHTHTHTHTYARTHTHAHARAEEEKERWRCEECQIH